MYTGLQYLLDGFRELKLPISKVEKDLGFSNGLIGKSAKKGKLSEEKMKKLTDYYLAQIVKRGEDRAHEDIKKMTPQTVTIDLSKSMEDPLKEMKEYADDVNYAHKYAKNKGITLKELCDRYELMLAQTSVPVMKIEEKKVIVNDLNAQAEPKSKAYDPYKDPTWKKKMGL
jgi:hypothetical protein